MIYVRLSSHSCYYREAYDLIMVLYETKYSFLGILENKYTIDTIKDKYYANF